MTHGYEYFEYDYFDLDESDFYDELWTVDEEIEALWAELEQDTYQDVIDESDTFDIYEQGDQE